LLLQSLRVRDWRNFADASVEFGSRVTVFFGQNGQGKSNLLEAAYVLVGFRSFRTSSTSDLIRWGAAGARLEARVLLKELERKLAVELGPGRRKTSVDGKSVRRDSASLEGAGVVVFSPSDLQLPKGPAAERRKALDRAVFAVHRGYYGEAMDFERALKGRNGLLRRGTFTPDLLESYNETLARMGARIVARRRQVVSALAPMFGELFTEIHGGLTASIHYRSDESVEAAGSEEAITNALRNGLVAETPKDVRRGFTGFGPQTDDLEMTLGEHPAKEHGSQGQLRSLVLALKIAELRHASERNGESPLLLLDDVASELDEERRGRLFGTIANMACQTLITVTEREHLPALDGRTDWQVTAGQVARV
jgi:DNA replication and repair protein RecF